MKKKVVVLGAGYIGKAIALDLQRNFRVTAVDVDVQRLQALKTPHGLQTVQADLSDSTAVRQVIADADLVVGALPSAIGFQTLRTVIEAGKPVVDISFFSQDPFSLDRLATQREVVAVVDCGVAPGLSNIILGYHNQHMRVERFRCLVGGLPVARSLPYQYKAPFSPRDVLEEYTRPARLVENGQIVVKPALSDIELVEFPNIGTLEAFLTDGLRSLLHTMSIPNMVEKTLRYPGHAELMRVFRDTGFFDSEPVQINDRTVAPVEVTAKLLFPHWKLQPGEEEWTLLRVEISGTEAGEKKSYCYELQDRYHPGTRTTSMARTTGYTCAAVANLILEGKFHRKGISPPELVGAHGDCFSEVIAYLEQREVRLSFRETSASK